MRAARRLQALSTGLEWGLYAVIALSVAAFGSVHPWAYVTLWLASGLLAALLGERALTIRLLRGLVGRRRFSFHPSGLWIVLDEGPRESGRERSFDLDRPVVPPAPLLLPGLALAAVILLQLVPLPPSLVVFLNGRQAKLVPSGGGWLPLTLSVPDTLRGLVFLASLLALHAVAAAVFDGEQAQRRCRRFVGFLGLGLALVALAQMASGTELVYGFFRPEEWDGTLTLFGPFVSRNHFAGYMLIVVPVALGAAVEAARRYAARLGPRGGLRRWLLGLRSPEGTTLIYGSACALAAVASLVASRSRGGLVAFTASLLVASVSARGRLRTAALVFPLFLAGVAVWWFGAERLGDRFATIVQDAPARTLVWQDSLRRMDHLWLLGSGFNTFAPAMSRVTAWALPKGATPWSEPYETSVALVPRAGYRALVGVSGLAWYREAHNDYLQVLVETGVPGLLIVLAAIAGLLRSVWKDPWLVAAASGVALHSLVDFDMQIPAIGVLLVVVAALAGRPAGSSATPGP